MGGNPFPYDGISKSFLALLPLTMWTSQNARHGLGRRKRSRKVTLIKILSGGIQPDAGEIFIDGAPLRVNNPSCAAQLGISVIHQELNLIGNLMTKYIPRA